MTVAVVIPWRGGDPARERALAWVLDRYEVEHPGWTVAIAEAPPGPWCKAACILDGVAAVESDRIIVADADVWCDSITDAVDALQHHAWAVPHGDVHRLTDDATGRFLAGAQPDGLATTEPPYPGHPGGGLVVIRRDVILDVPPDRRFVGWGQEDDAWGIALSTLAGMPFRGDHPLWHLWHSPQERQSRLVGTPGGWSLFKRYQSANGQPDAMRALVEEDCDVSRIVSRP